MKKLWQFWAAFGVCLAIGVLGMTWLTERAIDMERREGTARREAEAARQRAALQERIAKALWRMDWTLAPLIAQEATRPSYLYRPLLDAPSGKGGETTVVSPLLTEPPHFVVLNFDVSVGEGWNSPQAPQGNAESAAVAAGISPQLLTTNRLRLQSLEDAVSFETLLASLPDTLLPAVVAADGRAFAAEHAEPPRNYTTLGKFATPPQQQQQQLGQVTQQSVPMPQAPPAAHQLEQRTEFAQENSWQEPQQQAAVPPAPQRRSPPSPAPTFEQQEWQRRNLGVQNLAHAQRAQLFSNSAFLLEPSLEREGVSRPMWLGSKLILARRVVNNGDVRIQGCWLDWPAIKQRLQTEVADLFPDIELLPVVEDQNVPAGHLLATLPVQLVVPEAPVPGADVAGDSSSWHGSAMRFSLVIAWCCLLLGSLAVAIMLRGVLLLSERRASFVSAVTHELRSPLTTFRMYAEMLAEGMVRDDAQRVRYLATLRAEAERLTHLVDNVLQYARLERSRKSRPRIALDFQTLVRQTTERLPQRALQSGMEWHDRMDPQAASAVVLTDPAAVEQILFNLVDNACKYAAQAKDRRIHLQCSVTECVARMRVSDHGPGIEPSRARKLFRAFGKSDQEAAQSAPGIGLGLALCRRLARDIGGRLSLDPASPQGAAFLLELPLAK